MNMKPCGDCGAPMVHLDRDGTFMCSRLRDLAIRRFMVDDRRVVSHASLDDAPLVGEDRK